MKDMAKIRILLWYYGTDFALIKRYHPFSFYGCIKGGLSKISVNFLFIFSILSIFVSLLRLSVSFVYICLPVLLVFSACLSFLSVCMSFLSVSLFFLSLCLLFKNEKVIFVFLFELSLTLKNVWSCLSFKLDDSSVYYTSNSYSSENLFVINGSKLTWKGALDVSCTCQILMEYQTNLLTFSLCREMELIKHQH